MVNKHKTTGESPLEYLQRIDAKLDKILLEQKMLNERLNRHIEFIDNTYEGLKNPIKFATKMLGGR